MNTLELYDVVIVGGGAAGLMTGVQLGRCRSDLKMILLDGARRLGAKILISGGGRCNVTNRNVTEKDFYGGSRNVVKRILKAFPAKAAAQFFDDAGVALHEEEHGKLFPDSNRARSVLDALVSAVEKQDGILKTEQRVERISKTDEGFRIETANDHYQSRVVVLATGGKSVPKTGSDGFGYQLAASLGHSLVPTIPALAPMLLSGEFHASLSGVSQTVELVLHATGEKPMKFEGDLLWTHFGISGPVVLNLSRHWHAAYESQKNPRVLCNVVPEFESQEFEREVLKWIEDQPTSTIRKRLSRTLPNRFVDAVLTEMQIPLELRLADLTKVQRRQLVQQLTARELPISDSRGFQYAEATAGGIPLSEISPSTMESKLCPGLFLVGEILDVDGRLGGFNFQWAWSSATVAAEGISKSLGTG